MLAKGWIARRGGKALAILGLIALGCSLAAQTAKQEMQIYFIDVEGGQATLFVAPTGGSLLIDTGWPDHGGRDADRIVAAAKKARLSRIDFVLLTHYHDDHAGGVPQLVARIPVGTFIDHGANIEIQADSPTEKRWEAYQQVLATGRYKHLVALPGEVLPVDGMKVTVVSGAGKVLDRSLPGGGETNRYCSVSEDKPVDHSENAQSLGVVIDFGKLRILDLGDLTWDKEIELMCPVNRIGRMDLLVVSHHGYVASSSHALVDAIHARVAIMDNAPRKGGDVAVLDTIRNAPGLKALWQLHYSEEGGKQHNTPAEFIANAEGTDAGNYILVRASAGGSFSVFNSGNGKSQQYPAN